MIVLISLLPLWPYVRSVEIFLSSILIPITMHLSCKIENFILITTCLQNIHSLSGCLKKNYQLELLGSKCFNRISKLHVLHSTYKKGNLSEVFNGKPVLTIHAWQCNMKSETRRKCKTKRRHENNATRKRSNMKIVQHRASAIWRKCNMEIAKQEKGATRKKCNMKRMHHEESLHQTNATKKWNMNAIQKAKK